MKRRDFWKPIVAGALAPAGFLAAAKAEPKPKFPRYFVHARRFIHGIAYAEWRSRDELWFIGFDGKRSHRATAYLPPDAPERHTQTWFVNDCLSRKCWREITATEAEALLKPMLPIGVCPACGRWGVIKACHEDGRFYPTLLSCPECGTVFAATEAMLGPRAGPYAEVFGVGIPQRILREHEAHVAAHQRLIAAYGRTHT